MHPLIPYYSILSAMGLLGLRLRTGGDRVLIQCVAWASMAVVTFAILFRPLTGDTGRYYASFLVWRDMHLTDALAEVGNNWMFVGLVWLLGQLGDNPLYLITPITLACIWLLGSTLRSVLGPTYAAYGVFLYSAYPFFIFYVASGMKQALAMALLFVAYVQLHKQNRFGWICLVLAPLFHTGATLALPFAIFHIALWRTWFSRRRVLMLCITVYAFAVVTAVTGFNATLTSLIKELTQFADNYEIYFADAAAYRYQAGFRIDFALFSLLPFFAAIFLQNIGRGLTWHISGWWLSLYALLAAIYQFFAFAPFADRFAAFAWYLIPFVLLVMLSETRSRRAFQVTILTFSVLNVLILQFYTGNNLTVVW